jgi:hypothetical protein
MAYSYWMSFVSNVLGGLGADGGVGIRRHGRSQARHLDAGVGWGEALSDRRPGTTLRHGNFDYVTKHGEMGSGHH